MTTEYILIQDIKCNTPGDDFNLKILTESMVTTLLLQISSGIIFTRRIIKNIMT